MRTVDIVVSGARAHEHDAGARARRVVEHTGVEVLAMTHDPRTGRIEMQAGGDWDPEILRALYAAGYERVHVSPSLIRIELSEALSYGVPCLGCGQWETACTCED